ncbi:hypothetical protein Tco_0052575, partial [Tanacetum coccineum]
LLPNFTKVQAASPKRNLCRIHAPWQGARVQWKFQFSLHSCSLAGSTSAMKVSNWGGHLHFREVGEGYQKTLRGLLLQTIHGQEINKYEQEIWTNKGGIGAADQIIKERPKDVTPHNWNKLVDFWIDSKRAHMEEFQNNNEQHPSLMRSYYDLQTKRDFWRDDGSKELYNQGMSQLATMVPGSTTDVGSTSRTASASEDPSSSGNVDPFSSRSLDGDDKDVVDVRDL